MIKIVRFIVFKYSFLILISMASCHSVDWRSASRESIGIAPKADELTEDIFQVYTARAFSWRGYFGVHPWIAWKRVSEQDYTVAQVIGWRLRSHGSAVDVHQGFPDRKWFDSSPAVLTTLRGDEATAAILQVEKLVETYPHADEYRVWPGPNSNTFVDYIIRNIPELTTELPPTAIGKDYLVDGAVFDWAPSGTGVQASLLGVLSVSVGLAEGIEVSVLGLTFGLDVVRPALKLPLIGRVGFPDVNL